MVIIEEEDLKVKKCIKCRDPNRRCYAVKVCIEKNPTAKCKQKEPTIRIGNKPLPCNPPPPIIPPLPPLRKPLKISCACEPVVPTKKKTKKCKAKTAYQEKESQTQPPPKKEMEIQCSLGASKCTQESHCQTSHKEQKHCGHQTSIRCEKGTKQCQTDLERACGATGVAHDKNICTKPCCKKTNKNCDASCQSQPNNICNKKKVNNCLPRSNRECGNRPACEQKHSFPFVGRTSSGNLKVRPSMVSYENKEFGILVADRNSIRTSVKRISTCDMILHEESPCSPPAPPSPPNRLPKHFCCREVTSPCSSPRESCRTAHSNRARLHKTEHHTPHHHHNECDLELVQPSYYTGRFADEDGAHYTTMEHTHISHNNRLGYSDCWNYVNPRFQKDHRVHQHHYNNKNNMSAHHVGRQFVCYDLPVPQREGGQRERNLEANNNLTQETRRKVKPTDTYREAPQQFEGILETGMSVHEHIDDLKDSYNYNSGSDGSHNSVLFEEKEESKPGANNDVRHAPYTPAFPQDKIRHHQHRHQMSDHESYYTPTQMTSDDEGAITSTTIMSHSFSTTQPPPQHYSTHHSNKHLPREIEPSMVGRLHYVVKGTVDPDAKVTVGDAVFPVHSVVLEIHSKLPNHTGAPIDNEIQNVKLSDFNSIPIRFDEDESSPGNEMVHLDAEACTKRDGESRRNVGSERSVNKVAQPSVVPVHSSHHTSAVPVHSSHHTSAVPVYSSHHTSAVPAHSSHQPTRTATNDHHVIRSYSHLPPGYYDQHSDKYPPPEDIQPCQSCRSNNTQFHRLQNSPSIVDLAEEQFEDEAAYPDQVQSNNLVPISTKESVFRITEPNSNSNSQIEQFKEEETIHPQTPTEMGYPQYQPSEETDMEEEQIGLLPNLDIIQGAILVFGGVNPKLPCTIGGNSGRDVCMYTMDTDEWNDVGVLPHPRTHFGLARVKNDVYVIGGTDPEQKDDHRKSIAVDTNFRLNLRSGKWDTVPGLEKARSHFGCVAIGTNIFIIGGNIESRATSTCLVFDTENQTWSPIASLDTTRANMGIAVYGNGVLVAGGTNKDMKKPVLETVAYYEPTFDSWTVWKSLPSPRAFCSLEVVRDKIYLIAGAGIRDVHIRKNSSLSDILEYDDDSNSWVHAGVIAHARHGHATAVLDESIIIIGGVSSHIIGPINSVEIWSPSSTSSRNAKRFRHSQSGMLAITL